MKSYFWNISTENWRSPSPTWQPDEERSRSRCSDYEAKPDLVSTSLALKLKPSPSVIIIYINRAWWCNECLSDPHMIHRHRPEPAWWVFGAQKTAESPSIAPTLTLYRVCSANHIPNCIRFWLKIVIIWLKFIARYYLQLGVYSKRRGSILLSSALFGIDQKNTERGIRWCWWLNQYFGRLPR